VTDWYVAPALLTLRAEVDAAYPDRDKASDGTIGDPSHAARASDHNPDWDSIPPGCVRAMDVDSNGAPGALTDLVTDLLRATIGDTRVWYVIWDGKIYSRTYGWAPRVYTGASPHDHHVHISLQGMEVTQAAAHAYAFDTSPWDLGADPTGTTLPAVRLHRVTDAARHPRREWAPVNVRRVQRALIARGMNRGQAAALVVNGRYDQATRQAYRTWQERLGYRGQDADGLPGVHSLTLLGANRFRVLP
jgi:hypothetical protein